MELLRIEAAFKKDKLQMKKTKSTLRRPNEKLATQDHFNLSIDFTNSLQEDELAIAYYIANLILLA